MKKILIERNPETNTNDEKVGETILHVIKNFLILLLQSVGIGMAFGFTVSYLTKKFRFIA